MNALDDYRWLTSPDGLVAWKECASLERFPALSQLRRSSRCTDSQARLLADQWQWAQRSGRKKFVHPERWLWTQRLLEQSSDEATSRETSRDFPEECRIVDGCCGAGADSIACSDAQRHVLALDRDEIACMLAEANARLNGLELQVQCCEIESHLASRDDYWHLDPDRRAVGSRTIDPDCMSPNWSAIAAKIAGCRGASLKLAPGYRHGPDFPWAEAGPPHAMRWLSADGSVRQQRWYWRLERWPQGARIVSVEARSGEWVHEIFDEVEARQASEMLAWNQSLKVGAYLADQDPGLRAAGLSAALAARCNLQLLGGAMGYYHAEQAVPHPMLQWFRLLEVLPMDAKKIRSLARKMAVRTWELKSRGVDIDLQKIHHSLPTDPQSSEHRTILFTRIEKRHIALFAERMADHVATAQAT
jgi:hypothetical protein